MPFDLARLLLASLAIVGLMVASLWILSPFFTAIIWATMIVVACWPLMLRVQSMLHGRRALAVTAMTLLMLAVFIVPLLLAVNTIVENAATLVGWARMASTFEVPPPPAWVAAVPLAGGWLAEAWAGLREAGIESLIKSASPYAGRGAQWVAAQAGNLGLLLVHFLLTVIIAAVMFAQGENGATRVLALARRLGAERAEEAVRLAAAAIRGVALGVVVTALLQTLAAGIGLFIAGIPFAGLLTAVTLILCIAQIGAGLVMIPAVIWLFWSGDTSWGMFLAVWSVIVLTMDNFIRPFLIRKGADLPLLLIFAGVIGGLLSMGLVGLFVGPVVLAVTYRLFEAWAGLYVPPPAVAAAATVRATGSAESVAPGAVTAVTAATDATDATGATGATGAAPIAPIAPSPPGADAGVVAAPAVMHATPPPTRAPHDDPAAGR
ncbi:MAG: AI-2E family transporter YdiK [Burkholderiaceae bacterium]|nr:AI-2E family transporter YdiK [Burkholderiaceae bacterium]